MTNPNLLSSYTDAETGIYVEHWKREFPVIGMPPTFWFAYAPNEPSALYGEAGDTAADALAKVLARFPELRRAA